MNHRFSGVLATIALLAAGSGQAASIAFDTATTSATPRTAQFNIVLDMTGANSGGGGIELAFSGGISFVSFSPSAYFNQFDTDPNSNSDFSGYGDAPGANPFQLYMASFSLPITGLNTLGTVTVNIASPGQIAMVVSPTFGEFIDFNTAEPIPGFSYGTLTAVPLPAAAWLFATAFAGVAGWSRRRRA